MKLFLKIFAIALACIILAGAAGWIAYDKLFYEETKELEEDIVNVDEDQDGNKDVEKEEKEDEKEKDPLKEAYENSNRVNFLLVGIQNGMTDTIILTSLDRDTKKVDMISIPRDTYYWRKGYDRPAEERKVNAAYPDHGIEATKKIVSDILMDIPIDYYVKVDYRGVEKIVDAIGGVKVNIPINMNYDDEWDKPELHIHFSKGTKILNGQEAIEFLRFRKNNDGTGYPDGDLGRIKAQQQFIKSAINKALSFKLPSVIQKSIKHVKTDVNLKDAILYASDVSNLDVSSDVSMITIPGYDKYTDKGAGKSSYFFHDPKEVKKVIMNLYGVEEEEQENKEE